MQKLYVLHVNVSNEIFSKTFKNKYIKDMFMLKTLMNASTSTLCVYGCERMWVACRRR